MTNGPRNFGTAGSRASSYQIHEMQRAHQQLLAGELRSTIVIGGFPTPQVEDPIKTVCHWCCEARLSWRPEKPHSNGSLRQDLLAIANAMVWCTHLGAPWTKHFRGEHNLEHHGQNSPGTKCVLNREFLNIVVFWAVWIQTLRNYHYTQRDYWSELYYDPIIFGNSCSDWRTDLFLELMGLGKVVWAQDYRILYRIAVGIIFGNFGGGITEPKLFWN